ncbi:hypothetical protein [Calothrix sp. NIES-2098]|uniref:hypothetical protein n=1 Tax=Calothrix sp. NIES-2098 TaxID=1954171 RepID=UPI000B5E3D3C|nr:hypothetical protein NIES2098_13030 [Calothrix sp. NIES-2098]
MAKFVIKTLLLKIDAGSKTVYNLLNPPNKGGILDQFSPFKARVDQQVFIITADFLAITL